MNASRNWSRSLRRALCGPLEGLPWWLRFATGAERLREAEESPLQDERAEATRRFAGLLTGEWTVAIALSLLFTHKSAFGRGIAEQHLIAYAVLLGGAYTGTFLFARRTKVSSRWTWIAAAVCQMGMSSLLMNLANGEFGTRMLPFVSLILLGWYADLYVLVAANVMLVIDRFAHDWLLHRPAPVHLPKTWVEALSFFGWILAIDSLLVWTVRRRVAEVTRNHQHRREQEQLLYRALHDAVTGLPNRAAFEAQVEERMLQGSPLSCVLVEVDTLRSASEMLGLRGGEELLRSMTDRLRRCVGECALSRYDGQTFAVTLHQPHGRPQLDALCDGILYAMTQPLMVNDNAFETNISLGVATFPEDGRDRETLLLAAARASEAARVRGRNSYNYAADLTDGSADRSRMLSKKLQRALLEGSLTLVYQPIFRDGVKAVAAEVLARWNDPEEGHISPAEFIPLAEATGLIVPLSNWVLQTACEQMVGWLNAGSQLQRIAVNVSVMQVWRNDFVSTVERTLRATGLSPNRLELEVTEGALAGDFEVVKQHLQELRRLGIRIAIDDFGTGYSSLGRVRELDADTLKIDKLFVQGAAETPNGVAVVEAIIDMAHRLNLTVVAEGVETQEQLEMLRSMGCDDMQGFLLARPLPPDAIGPSKKRQKRKAPAGLHLLPRMA